MLRILCSVVAFTTFVTCQGEDSPTEGLTQCQIEEKSDTSSRITCDKFGLFTLKQTGPFVDRCVHTRTGRTIPGKMVDHKLSLDCSELTACQRKWLIEQDISNDEPPRVDYFPATCTEDGHYKHEYCHPLLSGCTCMVPQTGSVIPGPRVPRCNPENYTPCQLAFIEADLNRRRNFVLPKCSPIDGHYPQKICDDEDDVCYCQDRKTGMRFPGSGVNMNCDELTACQMQTVRAPADKRKACDSDGRFATKQCRISGKCKCVDADTGNRLPGTIRVPHRQSEDLTCPVASCPRDMVYSTCTACEATCENRHFVWNACTEMCGSRCTCAAGLVWSKVQKACVQPQDCGTETGLLGDSTEYGRARK